MANKTAGALLLFLVSSGYAAAQDAKTAVEDALKAMGPANLRTVQFTDSGSQPAQLMDGNTPGPRALIKYIFAVDCTLLECTGSRSTASR
jgi:hypothetical protein